MQSTKWIRWNQLGIWIGLEMLLAGCGDSPLKKGTVPVGTIDLPRENHSSERDSPLFQQTDPVANGRAATIHEPYRIELTGSNYRWHVRYPDGEGRFAEQGAGPIVRDVHVPAQTDVVLVLKSDDYVYTLALPQYELKEIAVPTLEFRMEFRPPDAGRFPLLGDELCGDPHPDLRGLLIVEPRDRFLTWLKNR